MDEKPDELQFSLLKPWRWPLDVLALFAVLGVAWGLIQLDYLYSFHQMQQQTATRQAMIRPATSGKSSPVPTKDWEEKL